MRLQELDSMKNTIGSLALLLALIGEAAVAPSFAVAQPGGGQGGGLGGLLGQGGLGGLMQQFGSPLGGGLMGLLQRPEVQQEIQLADEQRVALENLAAEQRGSMRTRMQGVFSGMGQGGNIDPQAMLEQMRARNAEANAELEGQLEKILRPFQLTRLKEIDVQQQLQRDGVTAMVSGPIGEALALGDVERQQLQRQSDEINRELDEQISKLRAQAQTKLINALPRAERTKLQRMMGRPFDLPPLPATGLQGLFQQGGGGGFQPAGGGQFQFQPPPGPGNDQAPGGGGQ
jgi:hypothetical protein